ncbi:TetR/AcrR family transcriptional regulator, partial [Nonomuraea sp. K274]
HDLIRERIVRAAIEIADADGLQEVTMRSVAGRLGLATMSLYRHVGGKDDLVMLMADAVIEEFPLPEAPPDGWRARLEIFARLQWATYRAHPWMAGIASLTRPLPAAGLLQYTEWTLVALEGTELDATTKMYVNILLYSYVQGIAAHLELEARARTSTGITGDEWVAQRMHEMRYVTESGRYPAFVEAMAEMDGDFDLDLDRLFEFGLDPLLDGLATVIEGR